MSADNKQLMRDIFAELAKGNGKPFVDSMADDFSWTIAGTSPWSRTWRGKQSVMDELMRPLFARFADTYTNQAQRFIAEGEYVVVECRGKVMTKSGKPYNNSYCYICRLADGKLRDLTEYMDTELASAALGAP
ncbi:nuclear transport factor 2 family protein [Piscinibacter sp.]|jgi:ketosteroid isomerase-like protein|uniref:nuclear transport factor 2 family protein n=1 Tax=Piscinibacter sp. TaxID=1903157 RepID=UPI00355A8693